MAKNPAKPRPANSSGSNYLAVDRMTFHIDSRATRRSTDLPHEGYFSFSSVASNAGFINLGKPAPTPSSKEGVPLMKIAKPLAAERRRKPLAEFRPNAKLVRSQSASVIPSKHRYEDQENQQENLPNKMHEPVLKGSALKEEARGVTGGGEKRRRGRRDDAGKTVRDSPPPAAKRARPPKPTKSVSMIETTRTPQPDGRYNPNQKPPYSYATLIAQALLSNESRRLTLSEIYLWISEHYPYYHMHDNNGWQNSIRHNLSVNKAFKKVERPHPLLGKTHKGSYWCLDPSAEQSFKRKYAMMNEECRNAVPLMNKATALQRACAASQRRRQSLDVESSSAISRPVPGQKRRPGRPKRASLGVSEGESEGEDEDEDGGDDNGKPSRPLRSTETADERVESKVAKEETAAAKSDSALKSKFEFDQSRLFMNHQLLSSILPPEKKPKYASLTKATEASAWRQQHRRLSSPPLSPMCSFSEGEEDDSSEDERFDLSASYYHSQRPRYPTLSSKHLKHITKLRSCSSPERSPPSPMNSPKLAPAHAPNLGAREEEGVRVGERALHGDEEAREMREGEEVENELGHAFYHEHSLLYNSLNCPELVDVPWGVHLSSLDFSRTPISREDDGTLAPLMTALPTSSSGPCTLLPPSISFTPSSILMALSSNPPGHLSGTGSMTNHGGAFPIEPLRFGSLANDLFMF
ncbi:uncharacterized protein VTP21DRAFT_6100 [Calcarisporiella thermophila]|uniref:uncharacterized protein n=1 Tax=Calcarisporiella thermophila TaxID=911321 RepID=UPI003742C559